MRHCPFMNGKVRERCYLVHTYEMPLLRTSLHKDALHRSIPGAPLSSTNEIASIEETIRTSLGRSMWVENSVDVLITIRISAQSVKATLYHKIVHSMFRKVRCSNCWESTLRAATVSIGHECSADHKSTKGAVQQNLILVTQSLEAILNNFLIKEYLNDGMRSGELDRCHVAKGCM